MECAGELRWVLGWLGESCACKVRSEERVVGGLGEVVGAGGKSSSKI